MFTVDFSIDLHCHPTYKPMGKTFKHTKYVQSDDPNDETSLWNYNPPSITDKILNELFSVTKFSQANLTAAYYGRVWVLSITLGSIEKWFFKNKLGTGFLANIVDNFAAGIGLAGIKGIEITNDYFWDLQNEIDFVIGNDETVIELDGNFCQYKIVNTFAELQEVIQQNIDSIEDANRNGGKTVKPITIAIILSIEGLHTLNCGLETACDPNTVRENAIALKNLPFKPWFVTFSHHFYNELCGQARSLSGTIAKLCDQSKGLGQSFTDLGREVLEILLNEEDGKRIFIDIKHLSPIARVEYMKRRQELDPENKIIPIIISHGACTGLPDMGSTRSEYPELGNNFCSDEINFYDHEIIEMVKTNGIFGLQLDERRVANKEAIRKTKNSFFKNKIMHYRSELLWNQIQYIAELLDNNGFPAWQHVAIGSDYDGIVDPLNSFWTIEQYENLKSHLERHAFNYLQNEINRLQLAQNRNITADQIVNNVFQMNAWDFLKRWY
ncbi:MAG: hypothetical protein JWN56_1222 [Sphingobacteriales bacterium]|nr:hypothetical protein [Sphingobacteriales bacterium]